MCLNIDLVLLAYTSLLRISTEALADESRILDEKQRDSTSTEVETPVIAPASIPLPEVAPSDQNTSRGLFTKALRSLSRSASNRDVTATESGPVPPLPSHGDAAAETV